jgi:PPP family 3-phenylpropionic acid transporter
MLPVQKESRLLKPKFYYFFYYAALSALLPYLSIYYKSLGFSGSAIGTLSAASTFVGLVCGPIWAAVADRYSKHRLALVGAIAGAIVMGFAISLARGFVAIMVMVAFYAFFSSPIVALVDSSVLVLLGSHKELYGRQRLWGAIGWGLAGPLVGQLTQRMGLNWGFYVYVLFGLVALVSAWVLPNSRPANHAPVWRGIKELFRQPAWVIFLVAMFLSSIGGSSTGYLFLHLQDHGGTQSLMGIVLTVGSFSEIIVFFLAGSWLRRWGARRMLILALAASSLRLFLYSLLRTAAWVLPIQLSHGLAFSLLMTAGVTYADSLAPTGFGTTAQSAYGVAGGLAGVIGSLVGGFIYDAAGSAAVFRWGSLVVAFSLTFLIMTSSKKPAIRHPSPTSEVPSD